LKTLEEPPRTVTIVLLSDEPEVLLETVRSRCQSITVRSVPDAAIRAALTERGVGADVAAEISGLSRGAAAWALAAAADAKLLEARRAERDAAVAWIESAPYDRLVMAFKLGEQFAARRSEVFGIVQAAAQHLREEMIRLAGGREARSGDDRAVAGDHAPALAASRAVAASLQCLADLEANVRPKLALEAMVMAWPSSGLNRV
jgi:DNA polymerase-3 subunit delta'